MYTTGLLVLSNAKQFPRTLKVIEKYVQSLYVHLDVSTNLCSVPLWSRFISELYVESASFSSANKQFNINVLVGPLKRKGALDVVSLKPIEVIFSDVKRSELCEELRTKLQVVKPIIYLEHETTNDLNGHQYLQPENNVKVYDNVVLGGTFDRIHIGHKIFLTEAVLRARQRLVVGVTTTQMTKSKILSELILPIKTRISEVQTFLKGIDSTLQYEVVSIEDPFGPTKIDPNMDMIVVSAETLKGGEKVNEIRIQNKLKPLDIYCVNLVECLDGTGPKEKKISSSNTRIDLLGTRLREPNPQTHLPTEPYIIGLTGGIASGKSQMASYLQLWSAEIMDCDKIAHELYEPGKVCYDKIIHNFGKVVLDNNNHIDRTKLGTLVFNDSKKLEHLNKIVWPELLDEVKRRINELPKKPNKHNIVVIEAAVLLKAGWDTEVHEVWSMIVPPHEAIRRVMERNNLTKEAASSRLASQLSNYEIVKRSHVIFSSQWEPAFTFKQAEKAWHLLMEYLCRKNSLKECNL